jgi:hypothetical protein
LSLRANTGDENVPDTPRELTNDHACVICGKEMPESSTVPPQGWAIRADNAVATCPEHTDMTPPAA